MEFVAKKKIVGKKIKTITQRDAIDPNPPTFLPGDRRSWGAGNVHGNWFPGDVCLRAELAAVSEFVPSGRG